jgi:hypothetical protein
LLLSRCHNSDTRCLGCVRSEESRRSHENEISGGAREKFKKAVQPHANFYAKLLADMLQIYMNRDRRQRALSEVGLNTLTKLVDPKDALGPRRLEIRVRKSLCTHHVSHNSMPREYQHIPQIYSEFDAYFGAL